MHHSIGSALLLLFSLHLCQASSNTPSRRDVITDYGYEVDLIYPRNTTFSNSQPVPIVFAIQPPLPLTANLLDGHIEWHVYPVGSEGNSSARGAGGNLLNIGSMFNFSAPYQSPAYQVDSMSDFVGIENHWVFTWSVSAKNWTGEYSNSNIPVERTNKLFFTTDRSAPPPDLVAATANNTCNNTQTAVFEVIAKHNDTQVTPWNVVAVCGNDIPTATPCKVKINAPRAEDVAAQITSKYCGATAYNLTMLNISCEGYPNPRSGALHAVEVSWGARAGLIFAALLGTVLML